GDPRPGRDAHHRPVHVPRPERPRPSPPGQAARPRLLLPEAGLPARRWHRPAPPGPADDDLRARARVSGRPPAGRHPPSPRRPAHAEVTPDVRLERWIDPRAYGFYGGDHHTHAAGCAHYTSPTEGVRAEDMLLQVKGEGLSVGCILTWGPCYDYQRQFFEASP